MRQKQLEGRELEIASHVKTIVLSILPDADVILYGSRARGDARQDSDWDFLVLTDEPVTVATEEKLRHAMYELSLDLAEIISAFVESRQQWLTAQESPYRREIEREGITV
jgi:predicted nucleotidyltransferase